MARIVSFVVLVAILLVIAGLFFKVMANFLLPMFMAVLLVIMFAPVHRWFVAKCKGRDRLAAGLTTLAIVLILLIPLLLIVLQAASESYTIYDSFRKSVSAAESEPAIGSPSEENSTADTPDDPRPAEDTPSLQRSLAEKVVEFGEDLGLQLRVDEVEQTIVAKAEEWLTPIALSTTQYVAGMLVGLFVMIISLYYFLVDGPGMVKTIMRLSPLEDKYEQQIVEQFADLTRAVVIATLASAVVQGILAGIGFLVAGLGGYVFLLTLLAMLFSLVPFIGVAAVWVPVCLWMYFFTPDQQTAAIVLAIYCATVVSMADNIIKPLILHGRSNLHPLLALLSVLGGVQALGPIGIFVGPMVVAFLQTLLNMLHTELDSMSNGLKTARQESASGG